MDSQNEPIRRKRGRPRLAKSAKRRKTDTGAVIAAPGVSGDDDGDDGMGGRAVADPADVSPHDYAAAEPSESTKAHYAQAILGNGSGIAFLSDHDVVLLAHPPQPSESEETHDDIVQLPPGRRTSKWDTSRMGLHKIVIDYWVNYLRSQMTGCTVFAATPLIQSLTASREVVCSVLRYSTMQGARSARARLRCLQCPRDGVTIALGATNTDNPAKKLTALRHSSCPDNEELLVKVLTRLASERLLVTGLKSQGPSPPGCETSNLNQIGTMGHSDNTDSTRASANEPGQSSSGHVEFLSETMAATRIGGDVLQKEIDLDRNATSARFAGDVEMTAESCIVRFGDLTEEERSLQFRYWGISADDHLAICPICSVAGHMEPTCPARTCQHCRAKDSHFTADCPARRKCSKCHERGHDTQSCPSKLKRSTLDGFDCDYCRGNHKEEECSWLWRTFDPSAASVLFTVDSRQMNMSCYECGAANHWGDDCERVQNSEKKLALNDMFSAKFASHFVSNSSGASHDTQELRIKGRGQQPKQDESEEAGAPRKPADFAQKQVDMALPPRPTVGNGTGPIRFETTKFTPINGNTAGNWQRPPKHESYRSVPPPDQQRNQQRNQQRPIDRARHNPAKQLGGDTDGDNGMPNHGRDFPVWPAHQQHGSRPHDWGRYDYYGERFHDNRDGSRRG